MRCVQLEVAWHSWSKIMGTKLVETETSTNPHTRSLYAAVLRSLNFSREQGKDFSKGKGDQIGTFLESRLLCIYYVRFLQ